MELFDEIDISDFTAACAKRFCPSCGEPIIPKQTGRPKTYCSVKCRVAGFRRHRKLEVENETRRTEGNTGNRTETG